MTDEVRQAVILMAYGSPDRIEDVPAYYDDIRGGRPVPQERIDELVERYRYLGIGDTPTSPLNVVTEQTRAALERELGIPVYTGMKHWHPRIPEAVQLALADGATTVVGLVLAPHYSRLSIGDYRRRLEEALDDRARLAFVDSWHDDAGLIAFLADRVRGTDAHVVFTAHSLPARILDEGDPYEKELLTTARLVAEEAQLEQWSFSYQSESATGEPWLGPDIVDHVAALHDQGVTDVLVCPIGFVADHLEIRWDIDVEAAEKARELGMNLDRIEMPNADPAFVAILARLVAQAVAEQPAPA
jgi:protoporphyrin/coproporphyrin ferrochelatase